MISEKFGTLCTWRDVLLGIVVERGVVQLGIVPVISASRRSRRARRCNAVPATGTRDYTNQYFLHISRVFPNWPAARATPPLDTAMPRFYDCLPGGDRISIESRGCASFLVFFFFSLFFFSFFSNKNTFQLSSTLFLRAKKWNGRGKNLLSAGVNRCWSVVRRVSILGPLSCHF